MSGSMPDGTVEKIDGGYALRYERHLRHPVEKVWAALTEPAKIEQWLAAAEIDLVEGGRVVLRWLNADQQGNQAVARGTVTRLEPKRLLEIDTDIHGRLLWQLHPEGDGCLLTLNVRASLPDDQLTEVLAGWHVHLDFLDDALNGRPIDWPNWPSERWVALHQRYNARFA